MAGYPPQGSQTDPDVTDRWARQLGQTDLARYNGAAVGPTNPVDTLEATPTGGATAQLALNGAAQNLAAQACKAINIVNPTGNNDVAIGFTNGVTLLTGLVLEGGREKTIAIDNANRLWVIGTALERINYMTVN